MLNKFILAVMAVLIFSSCSQKFGFMKRRYNKGYYIAHKHDHSEVKEKVAMTEKAINPLRSAPSVEVEQTEVKKVDAVVKNESTPLKLIPNVTAPKRDLVPFSVQKATASTSRSTVVKNELKAVPQDLKKESSVKRSSDSDVKLVIMIILCLFWLINLIPVYIHDGKDFTINFLVTLLLDLTWILGTIFAILVVLDIVDLR